MNPHRQYSAAWWKTEAEQVAGERWKSLKPLFESTSRSHYDMRFPSGERCFDAGTCAQMGFNAVNLAVSEGAKSPAVAVVKEKEHQQMRVF